MHTKPLNLFIYQTNCWVFPTELKRKIKRHWFIVLFIKYCHFLHHCGFVFRINIIYFKKWETPFDTMIDSTCLDRYNQLIAIQCTRCVAFKLQIAFVKFLFYWCACNFSYYIVKGNHHIGYLCRIDKICVCWTLNWIFFNRKWAVKLFIYVYKTPDMK